MAKLRENGPELERLAHHHSTDEHKARKAVQYWLSLLSPTSDEPDEPQSKDLSLMSRAIGSISEAAEENILTEKEAEAITKFLLEKFVQRRFDKTFRELFRAPVDSHWFLTAQRYFHE